MSTQSQTPTAPARDDFETYFAEKLWDWIPEIYRSEDGEGSNPHVLRALVQVFAKQAAVARRSIDRLWEDQFIEFCDDWAVPYIGELVATRLVSALNRRGRRVDVAKTIYYRRRKGTPLVLTELIQDITGWDGVLVEGFRRMVRARHGLDPKPERYRGTMSGTFPGGFADLRKPVAAESEGGPFDEYFHIADVRRLRGRHGRHNISKLNFHLYRLTPYEIEEVDPYALMLSPPGEEFTFDPSGRDIQLFARGTGGSSSNWEIMREWHVPGPIRCRLANHANYIVTQDIAARFSPTVAAALEQIVGQRFDSPEEFATRLDVLETESGAPVNAHLHDLLRMALTADSGKANLIPDSIALSWAGSTFVPTDHANCQLWLDAADLGTITEVLNKVSQWDDKSGNNRHVSQGNGALQPTTGSHSLNGLNILRFDASRLDVVDLLGLAGQPSMSAFIVARASDGQSNATNMLYIGQAGDGAQIQYRGDASQRFTDGTKRWLDDAFAAAGTLGAWVRSGPTQHADGSFFKNGQFADPVAVSGGTNTLNIAAGGTSVGGSFGGGDEFTGEIAEVIVYDRALTDMERMDVERYLAAKWGLPNAPVLEQVSTDRMLAGNLSDWVNCQPTPLTDVEVILDPENGRFSFTGNPAFVTGVDVDRYVYGFSANIGAGTYDRRDFIAPPSMPAGAELSGGGDTIGLATDAVNTINDNRSYNLIDAPFAVSNMVLQAANFKRPYVTQDIETTVDFQGGGTTATLTLEGLWYGHRTPDVDGRGDLILSGQYECVTIRHCTIDPGGERADDSTIPPIRIVVTGAIETLIIESSIVGPVIVDASGSVERLDIRDSIVDARRVTQGTDAEFAIKAQLGDVHLSRVTVFGEVKVNRLFATETLVDDTVNVTDNQNGCFRFSAAPNGSKLPPQFESHVDAPILPSYFTSLRFGDAGYAQLSETAPEYLVRGGENGAEIGVFNALLNAIKLDGLVAKVEEFQPVGLTPQYINET